MDFLKLANEQKENYLNDLNRLVACESVKDPSTAKEGAPFGEGVKSALDTFLDMARKDGFDVKDYDGYAGLVTYGDGDESVGVLGHLDVVPIGEGWTKNPLQVTEENGYVFGRGVLDDKGPLLAGYYALKLLRDNHVPLKKKILLIAGCDEESGMECMKYYRKHGPIPDMGFTPDAEFPVIHGEKGTLYLTFTGKDDLIDSFEAGTRPNVVIAKAKAVLNTDKIDPEEFSFFCQTKGMSGTIAVENGKAVIEMNGTGAHASMPWLGENAGVALLQYIGLAYDNQMAKDFYTIGKDWDGKSLGIFKNGLYMGFLTMNPGIIKAENGELSMLVDIRYPNDTTDEEVFEKAKATVEALSSDIAIEKGSGHAPLFVDPNSKLVKDLMAAYRKYTGDTFSPSITIGGGTYAKEFDNFVAFGPEKPDEVKTTDAFVGGCHARDEGIKTADLIEAIAIYADAIASLAGESA